jgi:hypothetical protein
MREKSKHYCLTFLLFAKLGKAQNNFPVAGMHPVKRADGYHGIFPFPKIIYGMIYFQAIYFSAKKRKLIRCSFPIERLKPVNNPYKFILITFFVPATLLNLH